MSQTESPKTKSKETNQTPEALRKKLRDIQQKLKAPKDQVNDYGKYKYRSCEAILEAAKPLLGDCLLFIGDDIVQVGDRYYVKATAVLSNGEGEFRVSAYARETETKKGMDASQITGSASSYARKYALNGLFLIDDTKDADTMDNTRPPTPTPPIVKASERTCSVCTKIVLPIVASYSKNKYGKVLCRGCQEREPKTDEMHGSYGQTSRQEGGALK